MINLSAQICCREFSRKQTERSLGQRHHLSAHGGGLAVSVRVLGFIIHSDRGVQYASDEFRKLLARYEFKQSMSRKANCHDNACAESFLLGLQKPGRI